MSRPESFSYEAQLGFLKTFYESFQSTRKVDPLVNSVPTLLMILSITESVKRARDFELNGPKHREAYQKGIDDAIEVLRNGQDTLFLPTSYTKGWATVRDRIIQTLSVFKKSGLPARRFFYFGS